MPYRDQAGEWVSARVEQIAHDINALDQAIAAWSKHLPDGASAPPEVLALFTQKEALLTELLRLHDGHQ